MMQDRSLSKPDRIRALFTDTLQKLSKSMILEKCPDNSTSAVEMTLAALVKEGYIIKTGAGKNTAYIRNTNLLKTEKESATPYSHLIISGGIK